MRPGAFRTGLLVVTLLLGHPSYTAEGSMDEQTRQKLQNEAISLFYAKRYYEALKLFQKILRAYPNDLVSRQYYEDAISKHTAANVLIKDAIQWLNRGNLNKALELLMKAHEFEPGYPKLAEKIQTVKKAIQSGGLLPALNKEKRERLSGWMAEAAAAEKAHEYSKALKLYKKVQSEMPYYTKVQAAISKLFKNLEHYRREKEYRDLLKKAEEAFSQKQYEHSLGMYKQLLLIRPEKQIRERIEEIERLIRQLAQEREKKRLASLYKKSGQRYVSIRKYDEAIEQFKLGKYTVPDFGDWDHLIQATREAKEAEQKRILARNLEKLRSSMEKGFLYLAREKFKKAIDAFETVKRLSKEYNQETTYQQAEDLITKAKENLRKLEEEKISPESPYYDLVMAQIKRGKTLYRDRKYAEAKKEFGAVLELFPKNREANEYFYLCNVQLQPELKPKLLENLKSQIEALKDSDPIEARRLIAIARKLEPENKEWEERRKKTKVNILPSKKISTKEAKRLYAKARKAYAQGKIKKAISLTETILRGDPTFTKAAVLKTKMQASLMFLKQKKEKTKPEAEKEYAKGMLHYNSGRIKEAVAHFEKALKIDSKFTRAKTALMKCRRYLSNT